MVELLAQLLTSLSLSLFPCQTVMQPVKNILSRLTFPLFANGLRPAALAAASDVV